MKVFRVEELKHIVNNFSEAQCDFLSENCIVAFQNNKHHSGCSVELVGDGTFSAFQVEWSTSVKLAGYKENKKVIEHAAEAVSFYLTKAITPYSVIEEGLIGTGFDYWLGYDIGDDLYDPKNFIKAKLEVSGISEESRNNSIFKRIRSKKKQIDSGDSVNLEAYVSIVEFSTPAGLSLPQDDLNQT